MESSALITCPSCGKQKAPEGFNNRSLRLHGPCRECRAEDNKKFKASKEGYFRHLIRNLATARKKSARKTSLSISLFVRDLVEIWEPKGEVRHHGDQHDARAGRRSPRPFGGH
eukprot:jgi/Mesvir1/11925/Mv00262-RA.1